LSLLPQEEEGMIDLDSPCVEPKKRKVAGVYKWAIHRFPIKGGLSSRDTWWKESMGKLVQNITRDNALLTMLRKGK